MKRESIAVLLTCHNGKNKMVACPSSFYRTSIPHRYEVDIFLMDDCSTDDLSGIGQKSKKCQL